VSDFNLGEMIESLKNANMAFEQMEEGLKLTAKMYWSAYVSLLDVGFTTEQAMGLIKTRGSCLL